MQMENKIDPAWSEETKKEINLRFNREMKNIQRDLASLENLNVSLTGIRARSYYFPAFGYNAVFAGFMLVAGFDLATALIWSWAFFLSLSIVSENNDWLDGQHGKIDYITEQFDLHQKAHNEGITIVSTNTIAQLQWIRYWIEKRRLKMPDDHPFNLLEQETRRKTRKYNRHILTSLKLGFVNFILDSMPWLSESAKEKAVDHFGELFRLLPDYLQWFFINNSYNPCC